MRLRQVALVARDLEPVAAGLKALFGLPEPFRDPHIIEFGLENVVFPVGDTFLEVVSPVRDGTTAGRYLERRGGDGGYMVLIQVDDVETVRERMPEIGVRIVWRGDRERIRGTHLHPKDVGGAILSLDDADPPQSWDWAGPDWEGRVDRSVTGEIVAVEIQGDDPPAMAARWAEVLDRPQSGDGDESLIELDRGAVRFVYPRDQRGEGVCGFDLAIVDRSAVARRAAERGFRVANDRIEIAGISVHLG